MSDAVAADYEKEQRIAVVMYGGVSLAIYIGGVAKELLALVRASAPAPATEGSTSPRVAAISRPKGVEAIYRKLAQWDPRSNRSPLESGQDDPLRTRYVVDIVSGTSAGGINGIFLARALAESRTLKAISDLWVEEGDFGKLLNDSESLEGVSGLQQQKPPVALLNGERMFRKLLGAFEEMEPAEPIDPGNRLDLYVTTTDVRGEAVRVPLANGMATEKRYRQGFHFVHEPDALRADFADDRKARLAFAARCTSSFPFAFEPFCWNDAARLARVTDEGWQDHLLYHSANYARRPLCDGGYLDNKPFSYVVDEMARRNSALPAARTLFFVEPDPQALDEAALEDLQIRKPNAIDNALSALISLPGYETIREDIERVVTRNKRVDTLQRLIEVMNKAFADLPEEALGREKLKNQGIPYIAYHEMKIDSVRDWFAELVCTAANIGDARIEQVLRDLVELWTDEAYRKGQGDEQFLLDLDFAFRLRKIGFLLRRANTLPPEVRSDVVEQLKAAYDKCYRLQREARSSIADGAQRLFGNCTLELQEIAGISDAATAAQALAQLYGKLHLSRTSPDRGEKLVAILQAIVKARQSLAAAVTKTDKEAREAELHLLFSEAPLDILEFYIETSMREGMRSVAHDLQRIAALPGADALRRDAQAFEQYDMVLFPLMREGGVGEPVHVDVVRVSPLDVNNSSRGVEKLAGTKLGHFGAFLEEDWRLNDILWGRLDGAESLIRQMMRGPHGDPFVEDVIAAAHEAIIEDLCDVLRERIARNQTSLNPPRKTPTPREADQIRMAALAMAKLDDKRAMVQYFADGQGFDLGYDRARQTNNAARAGRIIEKILSGIAEEKKAPFPRAIGAVMTFLWELVQISIPQSMPRLLFSHLAEVAFIVFAALGLGGYLTSSQSIMWIGLKGALLVVGVVVAAALLAYWFRERLRLHWLSALKALATFLLLAVLFVIAVTVKRDLPDSWWPAAASYAWKQVAAWLDVLELAVPRAVIYGLEALLAGLALALARAAGNATPKPGTA